MEPWKKYLWFSLFVPRQGCQNEWIAASLLYSDSQNIKCGSKWLRQINLKISWYRSTNVDTNSEYNYTVLENHDYKNSIILETTTKSHSQKHQKDSSKHKV